MSNILVGDSAVLPQTVLWPVSWNGYVLLTLILAIIRGKGSVLYIFTQITSPTLYLILHDVKFTRDILFHMVIALYFNLDWTFIFLSYIAQNNCLSIFETF